MHMSFLMGNRVDFMCVINCTYPLKFGSDNLWGTRYGTPSAPASPSPGGTSKTPEVYVQARSDVIYRPAQEVVFHVLLFDVL